MEKIIAFAGSNSSKSINYQLIKYIAQFNKKIESIKISEYDIPLYSSDIEEKKGIPDKIISFTNIINDVEKIIISIPEHNGNPSAFFKNFIDWLSRNDRYFLKDKKIILLSTSPGKGGAASALKVIENMFPRFGATIIATLSIGNFYEIFSENKINNKNINEKLINMIEKL